MAVLSSQTLRYILLPQIIPRVGTLFGEGFSYLAWSVAIVFWGVGLLPSSHPFLREENFGRFGVVGALHAAFAHLTFTRAHSDQVIVFFVILMGIVLLAVQCVLFIAAFIFVTSPVMAQAASMPFADWFTIPNPAQNIDRMILDRTLGVPGIFNSCVSTLVPCLDVHGNATIFSIPVFPHPIHVGLHSLLAFYTFGLWTVAAIIILYFVVAVTIETTTTGSPFGKRFSKAWVPFRIIMFVALMTPMGNYGLNGAQVLTLNVAQYGSAFATNAWLRFNTVLTGSYLGAHTTLIATPNIPELGSLVQFMFTAKACHLIEGGLHKGQRGAIEVYIVRGVLSGMIGGESSTDNAVLMSATSFEDAQAFVGNGPIAIRFGEKDKEKYPTEQGYVHPTCGEITIKPEDVIEVGSKKLYAGYYAMIGQMWADADMQGPALCLLEHTLTHAPNPACAPRPDGAFARAAIEKYEKILHTTLTESVEDQIAQMGWAVSPELLAKGWGGAGIWFNRIAAMNGAITTALLRLPVPSRFPALMEEVAQVRAKAEKAPGGSGMDRYNPRISTTNTIVALKDYPFPDGPEVAAALNAAYGIFETTGAKQSPQTEDSGNLFLNIVNFLFGSKGIFDMRANASAHPMAQLTTLGKGITERSIQFLTLSAVGTLGEKAAAMLFPEFKGAGETLKLASTFLLTFGMIGIIMGFILFYILPFMPFMYFFFAMAGWVKSIFEAMIGVPLWALGHLHIAGHGLSGQGASMGYFLLLGIFLRPILIVFGLVASVAFFSAMVLVLNGAYELLSDNLTGHNPQDIATGVLDISTYRGTVDVFFFTAVYVIFVYMIGMSSFKLIDEIPNLILRWMGSNAKIFQSNMGDPAEQLSSRIYSGATMMANQAQSVQSGRLALLMSPKL